MKESSAETIVVTGIGMCSSLGNAVTACAAARAGLSMCRDLADVLITCRDGADAAVAGHAVDGAAGFRGRARLVCLGMAAFEDLLESNDLRSQNHEKTGVYLCLRAPERGPAPDGGAPPASRLDGHRLCAQLAALASLPVPQSNWHHVEDGHAGFARAVIDASARLRAGSWHRCIVGGVDSLLDIDVLESLIRSGRVKTPDRPDGLQPGEAGALLLLERLDSARRRGANVMAYLEGASMSSEDNHSQSDRPCRGAGLTEAIARVLGASPSHGRGDLWLVSDHNGEHARASEIGHTLVRASQDFPALGASRPWCPATSFGDTGAASAAVAACLVTRAFARGYAPAATALILSSSDREARGALLLKREHS